MKIKLNKPFYCIGHIGKQTAAAANITSAGIFVTNEVMAHIDARHHRELAALGKTPEELVAYVLANYKEIRRGSGDSYLLVVPVRPAKVAAIGLEIRLSGLYGFWLVKSAFPLHDKRLSRYPLVYKKKPASLRGR